MKKVNLVEYRAAQGKGLWTDLTSMLSALWLSRIVILNLLHNQLTIRYQGSTFGILWAVLSPLLMMVSIAMIFPFLMRMKMENYVVYLFSGLMFWRVISNVITTGGLSIISDQNLVRQTALPSILYPLVTVMTEFVNFFIVLITIYCVGALFSFDTSLKITYLAASVLISFIFCVGLASVASIIIVYYRDIKHVMEVLVQALFYLTPIIYPLSFLPKSIGEYMIWNPFYHFVSLFQEAIYQQGTGDWSLFMWPIVISLTTLLSGIFLHSKYGRYIVFRL